MLDDYKVFTPSQEQQATISKMTSEFFNQQGFASIEYKGQYFETKLFDPNQRRESGPYTVDGEVYKKVNKSKSNIGDTRLSWQYVPCGEITVIA